VLAEMLCRGAGGRSARQQSDALDQLGVSRETSVQTHDLRLGATMLGDRLDDALPLLMDMIRRPNLADETFEPSRELAIQEIAALEDEPQQKLMIELKRAHLPDPINRSALGQTDHLQALTADDVRGFWQKRCVPTGAVLAFAGNLDWARIKDRVEAELAEWAGQADRLPPIEGRGPGSQHVVSQSAQQHIGLAFDAPAEPDEHSADHRVAAAVLSGGMSGRLFTEVREKRGLCYAVYASYQGMKDRGLMLAYAGTTTERATETRQVLEAEMRRLHEGVESDEYDRAMVGLKSRIVMQGESTGARAAAIATDLLNLGAPRTLEQRAAEIEAVSRDRLNDYLKANPPGAMTVVNIGSESLIETPVGAE